MLNKQILDHLYTKMGWSDKEIGIFFGVSRSAIGYQRKRHCIETRRSTGEIGEGFVIKELKRLGHKVLNLNEKDKTAPYDLLVDKHIRIDVKTAKELNGRYYFVLTDSEGVSCIESESRIRLDSKRTKKLFRKTCDFLILVGLRGKEFDCLIVPSKDLPDSLGTINVPSSFSAASKYNVYRGNWDLLKKNSPVRQH